MKKSLGIYIHIPFCVRKCKYCDFLSGVESVDTHKQYIEMLGGECELLSGDISKLHVRENV